MDSLELGKTTKTQTPITISLKERKQGTYVIGTTGTGKSTFLKNIIYQDMLNDPDHGLCILDPHGEDIELGYDYPLGTVPLFHTPNVAVIGNSTPPTQTWGKDLTLTVELLP